MDNSNVLIEIRNLGKTFEGAKPLTVLSNINLTVKEGEFISVVGPSGCGKTTLLRIISGLIPPSEGEIIFKGKNDGSHKEWHSGFVFQDPNLLPWRTAIDNTALALELDWQDPVSYYKKAKKVLNLVELSGFEDFYPKDLSGGMKQRVAIARSLVYDPLVLLMDEPFSALDEITRNKMNFELLRIWKQTHKTIIYVTHDIDEAVILSNRVVVLSKNPDGIKKIFDINLPIERNISTKDTKEFIQYRMEVREALHAANGINSCENKIHKPSTILTFKDRYKFYFYYALVLATFIGFWKLITFWFNIPTYLVPAPEKVFTEYILLLRSGTLMEHTVVTLNETLLGFVAGSALGIGIGYPLAKSKMLETILSPYIVAAQSAPKIAIAPLIIIWLGFGITSKIVLVMLIVFFPILINTMLGIRSVSENQIELFKSIQATKLQMFTKLELPSALPIIFAGFKTSITFAVIGAVVGEFVGATKGLGYLAIYGASMMNTAQVFVAIIQLTILGIILYAVTSIIGDKLMPWLKPDEVI